MQNGGRELFHIARVHAALRVLNRPAPQFHEDHASVLGAQDTPTEEIRAELQQAASLMCEPV
jgi:hypothetical protein